MDVSKAHKRIRLHPHDAALLCLFHRGRLYRYVTQNFGVRASSFWWGRTGGLLVRLSHFIVYCRHLMLLYVDDLLGAFYAPTATLWCSLVIILWMCVGVPISWHKTHLAAQVTSTGYVFNVASWSVSISEAKLLSFSNDLSTSRALVERLVGCLVWATDLWRHMRPTLTALYACLYRDTGVFVSLIAVHLHVTLLLCFAIRRACFLLLWRSAPPLFNQG